MEQTIASTSVATSEEESDRIYLKVTMRLLPIMFIGYIIAYLDRVNVGFAKLGMVDDLHFSDAVYGFGAGLFFISYFFFEVPSNLILEKVGVRRWISRIMVTWGMVSAGTAFVRTPESFYAMRFLLGIAEAGFFPGMVLYLTYWFPSHRRGKMMAFLMAGNPVSGILSGLISGSILHSMHSVMGMAGWQWLFILEAAPAVVVGIVIFFYLDDGIAKAKWLDDREKAFLISAVKAEAKVKTHSSLKSVFTSGRVWLLSLVLFGIVMGSYAVGFWQPQIIKNTGIKDPLFIGLLAMIPYTMALFAMVLTGRSADRTRERRWHMAVPALVASAGFAIVATFHTPTLAMLGLVMAAMGIITALPMFWALPTSFLSGTAAAAGIAFINCSGNVAGFVSPTIVGWLKDLTHSLTPGLALIAASLAASALLVLLFIPKNVVNR